MAAEAEKCRGFRAFDKGFDKFAHVLVYIGAVALIICMLIAAVDVILAKIFGSSLKYATELITYLDVPIAYLGMGYVWTHGQMTRVDFVHSAFPKLFQKITFLVFDAVCCAVSVFLTKMAIDEAADYFSRGVMSNVKEGFPIWPFVVIEVIGWAVLAIAFAVTFLRELLGINIDLGEKAEPALEEADLKAIEAAKTSALSGKNLAAEDAGISDVSGDSPKILKDETVEEGGRDGKEDES